MRLLIYILALLFLTSSCSSQDKNTVKPDNFFKELSPESDSTSFYFFCKPSWKDTTNDALDSFVNKWYSIMLFSLKEPILYNYKGDKTIIRFTWLRSFHHPVSVRLEKQGNRIKLYSKICDGAGGYDPGNIIVNDTILISEDKFNAVDQRVVDIGFWALPTEKNDERGMDGSEWVYEIYENGKYHMVTRWTPDKKGKKEYRSLGEFLISLTNISKKETKSFY